MKTTPDLSRSVWRKASRSAGNGGECVELAHLGAIRDSKNPNGPVLIADLPAMLGVIKAGRFGQ
jgi:hypothetical protein